jgi:hypothetical protein
MLECPFLKFLDPWGNRIEVVQYDQVQSKRQRAMLRSQYLKLDKDAKTP